MMKGAKAILNCKAQITAFFEVTLCLLIFSPITVPAETSPPTTYGLSLPRPLERISFPRLPIIKPMVERFVSFTLTIDSLGVVSDFVPNSDADSLYLPATDSLLRSYRFIPGSFRGIKKTMRLPVYVHDWPNVSRLRLLFPVEHNMAVSNINLYEQALQLNGVKLPIIDTFPSYYCDYPKEDSLPRYPFLLVRLSLDNQGSPVAIEKILSTAGTYTDQLLSVVNWAEYRPLEIAGHKEATTSFILISLYSEVGYPAKEITSVLADDSVSAQERWRVRLLADSVGSVMAPPIPRRYQDLTYTAIESLAVSYQIVSVRVRINKTGQTHIGRISNLSPKLKGLVREILDRQPFYPAIDYSGRPIQFGGVIYLDFSNSGIVRINPAWL